MFRVDVNLSDDELNPTYVFGPRNPNWTRSQESNLAFLRGQQNVMNDILRARGHVFVNEILDNLGFPRTFAGAIAGWAMGFKERVHIEFKMTTGEVDGSIHLTLNPQGVILDQVEPSHSIAVAHYDISHSK